MPQLLVFSRSRRTNVEIVDEQTIRSVCRVQDNLLDACVDITATLPDLEITRIQVVVDREDGTRCTNSLPRLQKAVGVRIGSGMTEILEGLLDAKATCSELTFMLEECCHGVILSLTRDVLAKAPADTEGKRAFFAQMVKKNIRLYNRCAAFAPGSSLVEGLQPPQ